MIPVVILAVIAFAIIAYVIGLYNSLQTIKTQIKASIQEIGNQLKRQASLIPNLEASVKGYMKHEKGVFEMLTDARKSIAKAADSGSAKDISSAIDKLNTLTPAISIAIEDNPEIKADASVTKFMSELTDTADKMMYARRSLIDLTQEYNAKLVTFPSNIVANMFGFKEEHGLGVALSGSHVEVSEDEMKDVKVDLQS
jgi:LemA protein